MTPPPAPRTECHARQYSDQMICGICERAWDVNDPDPPRCDGHRRAAAARTLVVQRERERANFPIRPSRRLVTLRAPTDPDPHVLRAMELAFRNGGASAAYRAILDLCSE